MAKGGVVRKWRLAPITEKRGPLAQYCETFFLEMGKVVPCQTKSVLEAMSACKVRKADPGCVVAPARRAQFHPFSLRRQG